MPASDYVRAWIDPAIKIEASNVLATLGLTVSDACRMMLTKVAVEKRLPFGSDIYAI
jgi:DNA-damage-inducible protein J